MSNSRSKPEVNRGNLKQLCWLNGMTISELARTIKRTRQTIYEAVENPDLCPIAYNLICKALTKRELN